MAENMQDKMQEEDVQDSSGGSRKKGRLESGRRDPELLIADLNKPQMVRMFIYAVLIHVVMVGATSIGFISLCVKYHSLNPREIVRTLEKEAAEKKVKEDATKASEEAMKVAKAANDEAKKSSKTGSKDAVAPAAGNGENPAAAPNGTAPAQPPEKKKSKIEQEVEKTSSERPTKTSIGLDITPDLE